MNKILIFGGTTEGRLLAEYCAEKKISVVHFIGAEKPWHLRGIKRLLYPLKVVLKNRYGFSAFLQYMKLIKV